MATADTSLLVQGSPEWKAARCGFITGSRAADVVAMTTKGEEKAARRDYRSEIICERLTRQPYPQYVTREMLWGIEQEQFARAAYEVKFGVEVDVVGFVQHPDVERFGCSPDGLVGDDGLIQIKCPTTATHIEWIRAGVVPLEHIPQMLAEMACTERTWCDFVSFDPRLPEHLQLFVVRYERDDHFVALLEDAVIHFNGEIDQVLDALPQGPQPAPKLLEFPCADEPPLTDEDCPF